jgi:MinD superfamily P-loop ATPase
MRIVIISGKGGVGKSMLTSSLALLFSKNKKKIVAVDCDVDAPNLGLWLGITKYNTVKNISTSKRAEITNQKLLDDKVLKVCNFGAISKEGKNYKINPFLCEGCGACGIVYPQAIKLKPIENGQIKIARTKYNFPLIVGQLYPGETGSGKIVSEIKEEAEKFKHDLMLIDSAPGTGCPVIAALRDSDFVVLVTEPTPSAFSDLKRVLKVVNHFKVPYKTIINKWDINKKMSNKIEKWAGNKFLGKISYDQEIFRAISNLTPIMETNLKAKQEIIQIYNKLVLDIQQ